MSDNLTVTINREKLIELFTQKEKECEEEYQKAYKTYKYKRDRWPKEVASSLREFAKNITNGAGEDLLKKREEEGHLDFMRYVAKQLPDVPVMPRKPIGAARLRKMVENSTQQKWRVSERQWAAWMEACRR